MSHTSSGLETALPKSSNGRTLLFKRLIDTVALPASRISPQNRSLAGEILIEMLFEANDEDRKLCVGRLQSAAEAPRRLLRYLGQCQIEVAKPLLENSKAFDASDLGDLVRTTSTEHRLAIAARKDLPVTVCDALIETGELEVVRRLLINTQASLSELGLDQLVVLSRQHEDLCAYIVKREELQPSQAMAMFWWSDGATRRTILTRQAADRMILIDQCSDVFSSFVKADYSDPVARKAFQMIERRQRNRAALERSDFESLEDAIASAAATGLTP